MPPDGVSVHDAFAVDRLGPPVVPFYPFLGEGSPSEIEKGTLILSFLLEDLVDDQQVLALLNQTSCQWEPGVTASGSFKQDAWAARFGSWWQAYVTHCYTALSAQSLV